MPTPKRKPKVIVVFPAKNEERTIGNCIKAARKSKYNPSIIVVEGHSTDNTEKIAKRLGAEIATPPQRVYPGKGLAMKTGMKEALRRKADITVFLDADIKNISPAWVDRLVDGIVLERYDMVRGTYLRAPHDAPVTKLVARRLLWVFFPEISHFEQPLSGEFAAKARVLRAVLREGLPDGWGIDVAILIEAKMLGYAIKEVFLGTKEHRSFLNYADDVGKLGRMSEQVAISILQKAKKYDRIDNIDEILT
jgi:glucosyl-3-phosphoglycerate synthase